MTINQGSVIPPDSDADTLWWWESVRDGKLMMPRCEPDGHVFFPPSPGCPVCGSAEIGRVDVSGRGRVYSWIVVHRALDPAYVGDVPYTIATVTLDEGPRVFGRIANGPLVADQPVVASIYSVDGVTLLGFERA